MSAMKRRSSSSRDNVSPNRKQPLLSITMEPLDVDKRIWPLILPYLSLCDIESISQTSSLLQELVESFIPLHGVQIEECCLKNSPEIYEKYDQTVSKLTLKSIPESDTYKLIGHFKSLTSLTMINVIILERGWENHIRMPSTLTELFLLECSIDLGWLYRCAEKLRSPLKKLHLRNLEYSFSPYSDTYAFNLPLYNIESLTIEGNALRISDSAYGGELKYLKIRSNDLVEFELYRATKRFPIFFFLLRELILDIPNDQLERFPFEIDTEQEYPLQRLTTRNLIPLGKLRALKMLEHLEVLSPVDLQFKDDIEGMNIKTVKVVYDQTSKPPEDTNLILKKLNDYCLQEIIKRLEVHEWMSFGQVHPKIEKILTEQFYPRAIVTEEDIEKSKIAEDLPHFQKVARRITEYKCYEEMKHLPMLQKHLTALTSLSLHEVPLFFYSYKVLPSRLKKLVLDGCWFPTTLTWYFRRLNSTLQVLEVFGRGSRSFNLKWLKPLRNLRELRIELSQTYEFGNLSLILQNNATTLERFELDHFELPPDIGWAALANVLEPIKSMKKLKVLGLKQTGIISAANLNLLEELLKIIGPQLRKLAVICFQVEMQEVLKCEGIKYLQELHISACKDLETVIASVATLKELQKLHIEFYHGRPKRLTDTDLVILVKALPKLTAIKMPDFGADWTFGVEFNEYLRGEKRKITITKVSGKN